MSLLDKPRLKLWISRFQECSAYFEPFGLNDIFNFVSWDFPTDFMLHMQSRWDPETRTYHLGTRQFCPTVEEFRAIMMIKPATVLRLKPYQNSMSFKKVLQTEFALPKNASDLILKDRCINFQKWHDFILKKGELPRDPWMTPMLISVLLAHFLLAPSGGAPLVKVFEVAYTLQQGFKDISGLVLAETLIGLNRCSKTSEISRRGSPLVLCIWLLDKLKMIPPALPKQVTSVNVLKHRLGQAIPAAIVEDDAPIRDLFPWHQIFEMKYSMKGHSVVILYGLEQAVSYPTNPLAAQFGRDKMPLSSVDAVHEDSPISFKMYRSYLDLWGDAKMLQVPSERVDGLGNYLDNPSANRRKTNELLQKSASKRIRRTRHDF